MKHSWDEEEDVDGSRAASLLRKRKRERKRKAFFLVGVRIIHAVWCAAL